MLRQQQEPGSRSLGKSLQRTSVYLSYPPHTARPARAFFILAITSAANARHIETSTTPHSHSMSRNRFTAIKSWISTKNFTLTKRLVRLRPIHARIAALSWVWLLALLSDVWLLLTRSRPSTLATSVLVAGAALSVLRLALNVERLAKRRWRR